MSTTTEKTEQNNGVSFEPASAADIGLLLVRLIPFTVLTIFGAQKLFGAFGGSGLSATADAFGQMGYQPAWLFAVVGGGSEFLGGLLLMAGLFTPLGTAMVLGVMINAIVAVSSKPLETLGFPIVLGAVAIALAFTGPGRYSLDAGRPWQRTGVAWAGASIGLAVITAVLSLLAKG